MSQSNSNSKGLLDLAVSVTGREVNMDFVQIIDQRAFAELSQLMMLGISSNKNLALNPEAMNIKGWCQDDGRLLIHVSINKARIGIVEVPKGQWKELTESELNAITNSLKADHIKNPAELDDLIEDMAAKIRHIEKESAKAQENLAKLKEKRAKKSEKITQAIFIFDRSPNSLMELKKLASSKSDIEPRADSWLATDAPFFICSTGDKNSKFWTAIIESVEQLMNGMLADVVKNIPDGPASSLLIMPWLEKSVSESLEKEWESLGGGKFTMVT